MDISHFAYLFFSWWTFVLCHLLAIADNITMNICIQLFVGTCVFYSLEYVWGVELLGHISNWAFNFLINYQTVFQSDWEHYGKWKSQTQRMAQYVFASWNVHNREIYWDKIDYWLVHRDWGEVRMGVIAKWHSIYLRVMKIFWNLMWWFIYNFLNIPKAIVIYFQNAQFYGMWTIFQ